MAGVAESVQNLLFRTWSAEPLITPPPRYEPGAFIRCRAHWATGDELAACRVSETWLCNYALDGVD